MKHIGVIGAGPAGSMQAVLLATLFPLEAIHVFDKPKEERGYPLQVLPSTISEIIKDLKEIRKSEETILRFGMKLFAKKKSRVVIENINETIKFLSKQFSIYFKVSTNTEAVAAALQAYALSLSKKNQERISTDNKQHGYVAFSNDLVASADLKEINFSPISMASLASDASAVRVLKRCQVVFGCDGATSQVRKIIFGDQGLAKDAADLSHLLQIELERLAPLDEIKTVLVRSKILALSQKGEIYFWNRGKNNKAILNIFVTKEIGDQLVGTIHDRLHDLPTELQVFCEKEIRETIGNGRFRPESLKITATPLHIFPTKKCHAVSNKRDYFLVGDAAHGLFLRNGLNHAFSVSMKVTKALYSGRFDDHRYHLVLENIKLVEESIAQQFDDYQQDESNQAFSLINDHANMPREPRPWHRPARPNHANFKDLIDHLPSYKHDVRYADFAYQLARVLFTTYRWLEKYMDSKGLNKQLMASVDHFIDETRKFIQETIRSDLSIEQKRKITVTYQEEAYATLKASSSLREIKQCVTEMLAVYTRFIAAENTTIKFRAAVKALDKKTFSELKEKLKALESAILKEPTPNDQNHLAVLSHFTDLSLQLAANKLNQSSFQKTIDSLERSLYGKKPLSYPVRTALSAVIGTLFGVLLTLGICVAFPLLSCPLIVGAGTIYGLIGGATFGLFSKYPKNRDAYDKERETIRANFQNTSSLDDAQNTIACALRKI